MVDEAKVAGAVSELKSADEEKLREVIKKWLESTQTDGLRIGASMISTAVYAIIKKHLVKTSKPSLNDYRRAIKEIEALIQKQLNNQTQQNNYKEGE